MIYAGKNLCVFKSNMNITEFGCLLIGLGLEYSLIFKTVFRIYDGFKYICKVLDYKNNFRLV